MVNLTKFYCNYIKTEHVGLDFVEKLWRNLRERLWKDLRKSFHRVVDFEVLHKNLGVFARFEEDCGKFSWWFCTLVFICKHGGFAHFPQSLLL